MPETARVSRRDREELIPAEEVREHDLLIVGAGERVATDGTVATGSSWVDTSAITGEAIPVEVSPGDEVRAGSVSGAAPLRVAATDDGRGRAPPRLGQPRGRTHATQ